MTETSAVIPASGLGRRLGSRSDKAFFEIAGVPLIAHTLAVFQECAEIGEIVLVVREARLADAEHLAHEYGLSKVSSVVPGGDVRQDSVRNGLESVSPDYSIIAIHDGARPFVTPEIIAASIEAAREDSAAVVTVPVVNTIKSSSDGTFVDSTVDRASLYAVQTPQTFSRSVIKHAYERAYVDGFYGTDDASLVERLGLPVRMVQGDYENMKVTTPADIRIAEAIVQRRRGLSEGMEIRPRIGQGYDIHRLVPGRKLFLGGVEFPGEIGLEGHSDADVMLHAVADAVLGAAGAGDIGRLFPNTNPAYKDIQSTILLARVGQAAAELGWRVGNVDVTLVAQRPRIADHASVMAANIAAALEIDPAQVSVKASTSEKLGPIGEGLGIECYAVACLFPDNP